MLWFGAYQGLNRFYGLAAIARAAVNRCNGIKIFLAVNHFAAFRAFAPKAITFVIFRCCPQHWGSFTSICKPVEKRHSRPVNTYLLKDPEGRVDHKAPDLVAGKPAEQATNSKKWSKGKGLPGSEFAA